jgi:hypothetical protein
MLFRVSHVMMVVAGLPLAHAARQSFRVRHLARPDRSTNGLPCINLVAIRFKVRSLVFAALGGTIMPDSWFQAFGAKL